MNGHIGYAAVEDIIAKLTLQMQARPELAGAVQAALVKHRKADREHAIGSDSYEELMKAAGAHLVPEMAGSCSSWGHRRERRRLHVSGMSVEMEFVPSSLGTEVVPLLEIYESKPKFSSAPTVQEAASNMLPWVKSKAKSMKALERAIKNLADGKPVRRTS